MGTFVDMPIATSAIDSSGEKLKIENVDISDVESGTAFANWEHDNSSPETAAVGIFRYAKKILKKEDCENNRQRKFWDQVKLPFIYGVCELFDDGIEPHPGSIAIAAMIKFFARKKEKIMVGASIEGVTLERDGNSLEKAVLRKVALTLKPCNKQCWVDLLSNTDAEKMLKKYESSVDDILMIESDSVLLDEFSTPEDPILDLYKSIESLNKTLEAGMGNVAPGQLTGNAALTREGLSGLKRNKLKYAIRTWDKKRPLKEVLKAALPDVSDQYLDHFVDIAEELSLKKNTTTKLIRIGSEHIGNSKSSDAQKQLISGLYLHPSHNPAKEFHPGHEEYSRALYKLKNDAGQHVLLKRPAEAGSFGPNTSVDSGANASNYSELAHSVFNMGKHVPITAHFTHPTLPGDEHGTGVYYQAQEIVPKSKTPYMHQDAWAEAKSKAHKDGTLDKLMIMDQVLGNGDRHLGNLLIHPDGHVMNIDHDMAFNYGGNFMPDYKDGLESEPLHPEAVKWVKNVNPKDLAAKMLDQGQKPAAIRMAIAGLKFYQKHGDKNMSTKQLHSNAEGHILSVENPQTQGIKGAS